MDYQLKIKSSRHIILPTRYIAALAIVLLLLLAIVYLYYYKLTTNLDSNYQSSIKTIAQSKNKDIDEWYTNWVNQLQNISKDSSIIGFLELNQTAPSNKLLRNNIEVHLKNYLENNLISVLEINNKDGKSIFSAGIKLDNKSKRINNIPVILIKDIKMDSCYFLVENKSEIRLVVLLSLQGDNKISGSVYAEINTDDVLGDLYNNILLNSKSDVDIYFIDGLKIKSLKQIFYDSLQLKGFDRPESVLNFSNIVYLNDQNGFASFNDKNNNEQIAYAVKNKNTDWIIASRDKNKEDYAYIIKNLSNYLLYGLAFLLIAAFLILILWQNILKLYSAAVIIDIEHEDLMARFNHLSKFSNDIFFLLNKSGNILDFNEKAFKTYGYSIEEFKELNIRDLRTIKDRDKTDEFFNKSGSQDGLVFDVIHRKKDRTEFEVEASLKQVQIKGKTYIQSIIRDISERKKSEKKIRESEEIFELIVNNLHEVVYIYSLKPKIKFDFISHSIESLTGYSQKGFYSDPLLISKIIHPDERYKLKLMMEGTLDENQSRIRLINKNGEQLWVQSKSVARKNKNKEAIAVVGIIRNITQQINSEMLLKKNEESFRYLFDNNPLPMWLYNFNSKQFINVNEAALKHYGYSREKFLTLKLSAILINNSSEISGDPYIQDVIKEGNTVEYMHTLKNGNIISVEVSSHSMQINGSGSSAVLEVVQDITERKKIEARIQESEQRFKTLAKISPVAIFRTNSWGELTYMNENWTEMTGIYPEIAFGHKWWEGLPIHDKDLIESRWKRSNQVSGNFESELELLNTKSKAKWVLASIVKITSSKDKIIGFVGTLTDVTRMKLFEGNFRKLYYSVEQSPVSIVITDTKGNIEFVNPAVIKTTGYSKEELLGNNPRVLKSGFQNKSFYKNLWDTISAGNIWIGEFKNRKKDGSSYWEQASISPVYNERKEITNYVAVKEDITNRKILQEELIKAKNDALESNKLKTNFLKKINHELRAPLVGIMGGANSVYEDAANPKLKEVGEILIKESARLNDSLKSILSLSSIETEQFNVSLEPINISKVIKNIYQQFLQKKKNKPLELKFSDIIDDTYVIANNELLSEIIYNLIDNAIKYTEQGSVTIYNEFTDDEYILSIRDTGIGIPVSSREIIFEPFRQADNLNGEKGGIGLGLTLSKKYTDVLGGKLWFKSEINKGTTFHLSLPLVKESEKPVKIKTPDILQPTVIVKEVAKKKLLIVEDDEVNLKITQMYLKNLFDISAAVNSSEALAKVANNKFDIIIMDIGLKDGLNGMELTKILRQMPDFATIPIIAVTAFTLTQDKDDIMNAGCSHYLSKPFVKEDLLNIVNAALT